MRPRLLLPAFLLAALLAPPGAARGEEAFRWNPWDAASFARAKEEHRVILVEVSAGWCHWCHVMERETYGDQRVRSRIAASFWPIQVDADARPDLAERFAEYHWPATVFLTPDAKPITALRGYRGPDDFLAILADVLAASREGRTLTDVTPPSGGSVAKKPEAATLSALRALLGARVSGSWDDAEAGWGFGQKYPLESPLENHLLEARMAGSSSPWRAEAFRVLSAEEALIDPVWGGMYQYSEGGVWTSPHFEKIMSVNAGAIATYAEAYRLSGFARWLADARNVRRYLTTRLRSPSGAFYTSQDADVLAHGDSPFLDGHEFFLQNDAGRRRLGEPRIDKSIYAQENGWAIAALCRLYEATGSDEELAFAKAAAEAILSTHRGPRGAFRHAASDRGVLHLGDTVAFGRALFAIAQATGDRAWLAEAVAAGNALLSEFGDPAGGGFFATTVDPTATGVFSERLKPFETNAAAARFLLALHAATDDARYRDAALRAIGSAGAEGLPERFHARAAILLLAVEEAIFPWIHVAVVGAPSDPGADLLWKAVLALPTPFVVRERVAPGEERPARSSSFPPTPSPAVYLCGDGRCSPPVTDAKDLAVAVEAFRKP